MIDLLDSFFFKQKTAYDMLISDWSSDVFSSDLRAVDLVAIGFEAPVAAIVRFERVVGDAFDQPVAAVAIGDQVGDRPDLEPVAPREGDEVVEQIGRAHV